MHPNIPPEPWLDTLTRVDELLISQIDQNKSIIDQNESIKSSLASIRDLLSSEHPEKGSFFITYPEAGGTKELAIGVTRFNFYEGKVTLPTGTRENLSDALSEHELTKCHSIAINTEFPITIRIEDYGAFTTNAGIPFILSNIEFQRVSITTTLKTHIAIFASTSPKAIHIEPPKFCTDNPFVSNTNVAVAGVPNTEEIYAGIGRNGRKGSLRHNGSSGILSAELSHNGTDFTDAIPIRPSDVLVFDKDNVHTIRIDADTNGTAYVLIMQSEV